MDFQPMFTNELTSEMKEKARNELKETSDNVERSLMEVKKLLTENIDFAFTEDDSFLMKFLRAKKFNALRTFNTIKNYYSFKKKYPGFLTDNIRAILKTGIITISPYRTRDGNAVMHINLNVLNFDEFTLEHYFQSFMLLLEQVIDDEGTQVCGGHLVLDCKGLTLSKIKQFSSPSFLAMLVKGVENAWPIRMKSCQIVNEPFYIKLPYNILVSFMSKKLKQRFALNGSNLSNVHKVIPVECLPTTLGGRLDSEALATQLDLAIARQIEIEHRKKSNIHRIHKRVRNSSCCLEETTTYFIENKSQPIKNLAS